MKKLICLMVAILALSGFALAEEPQNLVKNTPVSIDLDGDGTSEIIEWEMSPRDEYDSILTLKITTADNITIYYDTDIISAEEVYAVDLDSDGRTELLATGDICSDDYSTYCLRYENGALYELLFADACRGENSDGYFKSGYGIITDISNGELTLTGSQDVLGTWMAARRFTLTTSNRFELCDSGNWVREADLNSAELWEYAALTLKTNLEVELTDANGENTQTVTLNPGDKILITESNKVDEASFVMQDGRTGKFNICENYEQGWGSLVNDIPEEEVFEYIPYAD